MTEKASKVQVSNWMMGGGSAKAHVSEMHPIG